MSTNPAPAAGSSFNCDRCNGFHPPGPCANFAPAEYSEQLRQYLEECRARETAAPKAVQPNQIYVDALIDNGWRLGPNCHMYVAPQTDLEILHAFAARCGMKRTWFQNKPRSMPHYDLVKSRRDRAISLGAIEHDREQMVRCLHVWRTGKPCTCFICNPTET